MHNKEELKNLNEVKEKGSAPSTQTIDKPGKKFRYRKIADLIEKYISFLGKLFNRMLDRLFGKKA